MKTVKRQYLFKSIDSENLEKYLLVICKGQTPTLALVPFPWTLLHYKLM